jgi:hypothetical protein
MLPGCGGEADRPVIRAADRELKDIIIMLHHTNYPEALSTPYFSALPTHYVFPYTPSI